MSRQIGSLVEYNKNEEQRPEEKKYILQLDVVFICNIIEQKFLTCYEANDIVDEGKKVTIHENNIALFSEELANLTQKYCHKDAKEMLMSIEEHLESFHQYSHKILSGRLTQWNYELIGKLIDEFHIIRSAMKIIETKQGDFKG
ncbi:hypothetical protein [uncultured Granulicatella sp.]|uniref:hypothetical protein n=1 Tax=uncultured Granulicatella sp. TaxID=316089 RepID=UPI0028F13A71|nr:hypothetical protein [uncultured Granulicatella sp.]